MEKEKKDPKQLAIDIVLKIVLILTFSWGTWYSSQAFYNTLPFMSEGIVMLDMLDATAQKWMFLVVAPILSTLIIFGLVMLIERTVVVGIERNLTAFGKSMDKVWHKRAVELTAIGIAIGKGILETILAFNPLSANVVRPIVTMFIKLIFLGLFYLAIMKKDTKEMFPFVFSSLMFPTVLVILFV